MRLTHINIERVRYDDGDHDDDVCWYFGDLRESCLTVHTLVYLSHFESGLALSSTLTKRM